MKTCSILPHRLLSIACVVVLLPTAARAIELTADTPWVVSADEPEPMSRVIDDIARDWYKVLGYRPIILREPPKDYSGPIVYFGTQGEWLKPFHPKNYPGVESFRLQATKDSAGRPALVATGADLRGAMYAAYTVSEELLGVDPWYYWVDKEPAYRGSVNVADDLDHTYGPATFQYRGWFINDEDLLFVFARDPERQAIFSLDMWDRIYETLLRLRGNMVVPATFAFPDEKFQDLAAKRGLVLNMHHILTVGLNTFQWPDDQPFSYTKHPEILERYWQQCIDAFHGKEIVWTVGYRGKHDYPFWVNEPSIKTPEQRGAVITAAIAKQVELVRKVDPEGVMIANLWAEGVRMYEQGHVKIPDGVTIVWPDNGSGTILDGGRVQKGQGFYYHTHMRNGRANQLTEMVNPARIYRNFGRFLEAGADQFFLVNVSDVRGAPLSTDCTMKFAWDASPYQGHTNEANQEKFLLDWSTRQYGAEIAPEMASLHADYFAIPYMIDKSQSGEDNFFLLVRRLDRKLDKLLALKDGVPQKEVDGIRKRLSEFENYQKYTDELLQKAQDLEPRVPEHRRDFFRHHLLSQIQIHRAVQKMAHAYYSGVDLLMQNKKSEAEPEFQRAIEGFDDLQAAFRIAEYGKWRGFYQYDIMTWSPITRNYLRSRLAKVQGKTVPPLHPKEDYPRMYDYQDRYAENYPLMWPAKEKPQPVNGTKE